MQYGSGLQAWLAEEGVVNIYKNEIDFLVVPLYTHPLTCSEVGENKAEAIIYSIQNNHGLSFRFF